MAFSAGKVSASLLVAALLASCGSSDSSTEDGNKGDVAVEINAETWPKLTAPVALDPAIEARITELMAKMSVADKVGQTMQGELRHLTPEDVRKYRIGSVLNGGGSQPYGKRIAELEDWLSLADAYYEASMDTSSGGLAIPILWGTDAVHGHNNLRGATIFPHNIGLGAARNPELIKEIGTATAREVRATGQEWSFAPTLAVVRDDRWGRTYESYSEDPEVVYSYGGAMVEGIQGAVGDEDFLSGQHVISSAKHFLGDGGTKGGVDQGDNVDSEADLRDIHNAGYVSALDAGVQTVMASFSGWKGRKMHGRKDLLTDVLKDQMGFNGFVVGDWNGHGQVVDCSNESCAASFNAGVDMFMVPEDWKKLYENTLAQVATGEISMARLDDAVRRILRVKLRAGLFEAGKPSSRPLAADHSIIGHPDHQAIARRAAAESLVLIKNNDGLLPLKAGSRILVAGDGADNIGKQTGGWTLSWQGTGNSNADFPNGNSIWQGIEDAVAAGGGQAVLSVDGSYDEKPDVAIIVYGEDPYAEFQGDREHLAYANDKNNEIELLKALKADGIPVVSVFISGRPMYATPEINASDAFVAAWLPGSEGAGVADVLIGDATGQARADFKGKLSFSWPKKADQGPLNHNDENYDPLFAYGYGLDYSSDVTVAVLPEFEVPQDTSTSVFFEDGQVVPYRLKVMAAPEWSDELANTGGELKVKDRIEVMLADRNVQEDSRRINFKGKAAASALIHIFDTLDLSRESNGDMLLGMSFRVDEPATDAVYMTIGCGEGCMGTLDVSEKLKSVPQGEWVDMSIALKCFVAAGADMTKINTPWRLTTKGSLRLTMNAVRLTAPPADLSCPPAVAGNGVLPN
jgi:beta-glucosidase